MNYVAGRMLLTILFCCAIATVFTACTTDDDNQTAKPTDAKALVGTWECDLSGRTATCSS